MPELRRSARVASKPAPSQAPEAAAEAKTEPPAKKLKTSSVKELEVGDKIPDIKLLDDNENEVDLLKEAEAHKYVVIFAYPKASTPGCTRQVCGFQKNFDFFQNSNVKVYGLSADKPSAQKNFVTKQKLEYPLLSDPSRELIEVLGAKKEPTGIKRSHWIFANGTLKVKKIAISPEDSFNSAKTDIETFISESEQTEDKPATETKDEVKGQEESKESKESNEVSEPAADALVEDVKVKEDEVANPTSASA